MSRYRTDPVFRENKKAANKKYRKNQQKAARILKKKQKLYKKYWRKFKVDGVIVDCCKIGYLAETLGVEAQTVRAWHNRSQIPETFKFNKARYYTEKHFRLIHSCYAEFPTERNKFFTKVTNKW